LYICLLYALALRSTVQVQVSGTGCVRFPVQRTREIGREPAYRAPPDAALKFAQC